MGMRSQEELGWVRPSWQTTGREATPSREPFDKMLACGENRHTARELGSVYRPGWRSRIDARTLDRGVGHAEPTLDPGKLADEAGCAIAGLQGPRSPRRRRAPARRLSAARLRRR